MAWKTWRTLDELLERVRRQAQQRGRSFRHWMTTGLSATDPALSGDEPQQVRERLAAADLLGPVEPVEHRRPPEADVARARAAVRQGTPVSHLVAEGRR
jgi:hypothetical protein